MAQYVPLYLFTFFFVSKRLHFIENIYFLIYNENGGEQNGKEKNISIKEIAKLADVSVATVSRVINNNGRFSDKTKEKVETIIKEYGYTANIAAKSLRTSKSKTIGLIVPNIDNEWFSQLALDIENYFLNTIIQYLFVIPHKMKKKKLLISNH